MKNISLVFAIHCILFWIFLLNSNDVFVLCQGIELSEVFKTLLAQAPTKILSLFQLGLLLRLLSQRRNRISNAGSDGIDNDRDGFVDEEDEEAMDSNKKNVMIFMGKHNIQVSNHGLKNGEEEGEVEGEEGENPEYEAEEDYESVDGQDYGQEYPDNQYKDKYKLYKKIKDGKYGFPKGYGGEDNYNKDKKTKKYKKKTYKKDIKDSYESVDHESDEDDYEEDDFKPTFISYANSDIKQTQTLLPFLKKLTQMSDNEKIPKKAENKPPKDKRVQKDSNIMALPNGFPIGGSKLTTKSKGIKKRSDETPDYSDIEENELLESELLELLSDPEIIQFLIKLNESLANHTATEQLKRTKRQTSDEDYIDSDYTEEWPQSKSKKRWSLRILDSNFKPKNVSNYISRYLKNSSYSSAFEPIKSQKSIPLTSSPPIDDLKPQSSENSWSSYKLGDYMSFKPLSHKLKTSSSQSDPSYQMQVTDDDNYKEGPPQNEPKYGPNDGQDYGPNEGQDYGSNEGPNQEYSNEGKEYGQQYGQQPGKEYMTEDKKDEYEEEYGSGGKEYEGKQYEGKDDPYEGKDYNGGPEYGYNQPKYGEKPTKMYGRPAGVAGDHNTMAYGGIGTDYGTDQYSGVNPKLPVMDLSYWSKVIKKANKKKYKKKKKKNKKYSTTSSPEEQEEDLDDDYYEDYEEEEEEPKKMQTTIQIIKAGSKAGNIGINSHDEEQSSSSKSWVKSLPGFRKIFGKR